MKTPIFQDNVVVITGASLGIGRELALQLADQHAWLALAARNVENLESVSKQCRQRGGKAISIPTDIVNQGQCENLIEATIAEYGRIDTLINNASVGQDGLFNQMPDLVIFEKVIQVNLFGSVYCTFYALPYLKNSAGRLVFISSLRGLLPNSRADGYSVSKHAISGFCDSLRNELYQSEVSVTGIYPGWVSTGISARALRSDGTLRGKISKFEIGAMPVDTCARIIIRAIAERKREVLMTREGKLGFWLRPFLPGVIDRVIRKSM